MSRWQLAGLLAGLVLCFDAVAHAETYVAGLIGFAKPGPLESGNGNIELQNNVVFGAKFGAFLKSKDMSWLGIETEVYNTNPNIKQQRLPTNPAAGHYSGAIPGSDFGVTTVAFNAIARVPHTRTFQPYAGIGVGMNISRISGGGVRPEASFSPSFNLLAGVRGYVNDSVALFGEFKYNLSEVEFTRTPLSGAYRTMMFVTGLSFHYDH